MTVREAIEANDAAALRTASDANGVPAIRLALYHGRPDLARELRAAGDPLDLHTAAAMGVSMSGDLTSYSEDGWTALHLAAFFGQSALVQDLLARGASPLARSRNALENLPLHAAAAARQWEIVRILLEAGSPVNDTQHGGFTPLHSAANNGDRELAELLLAAGARKDLRTAEGRTAADLARTKGHTALAALLE